MTQTNEIAQIIKDLDKAPRNLTMANYLVQQFLYNANWVIKSGTAEQVDELLKDFTILTSEYRKILKR